MATTCTHNHFSKLFIAVILVSAIGMYSCNNTATKEEKKDSAAATAAPMDTTMKVKADSAKVDTGGKGGQPTPAGH
jgi:hypothetical protein